MRTAQRTILALGLLSVGCAASVFPGCGCTRTEIDRPHAKAADEDKKPHAPPQEHTTSPHSSPKPSTGNQAATPSNSPPTSEVPEKSPAAGATKTEKASAAKVDSVAGDGDDTGASLGQTAPKGPPGNVNDARREAKELAAAAKKSAIGGNFSQAFREARAGWQLASKFPHDAECQTLTRALSQQMQQLGAKANKNVKPDAGKTLIVE